MRSTKFPANCRPSRSVYKQTHTHTHSQWHTRATPKSRKANSNTELGWGWGWWLQLRGRAEQSKSVKSAKAQVDATSRQPAVPPTTPFSLSLPLCPLLHSLSVLFTFCFAGFSAAESEPSACLFACPSRTATSALRLLATARLVLGYALARFGHSCIVYVASVGNGPHADTDVPPGPTFN